MPTSEELAKWLAVLQDAQEAASRERSPEVQKLMEEATSPEERAKFKAAVDEGQKIASNLLRKTEESGVTTKMRSLCGGVCAGGCVGGCIITGGGGIAGAALGGTCLGWLAD
ncbi:MAG: hypothetical protein ACXV6K_08920 [Halobacteriota archaeon]